MATGCVAELGSPKGSGTETTIDELSVAGSIGSGCSTSVVRGLAEQLVAEVDCLEPGAFTRIDTIPGVTMSAGAASAPYLQGDAAAALRRAVARRSGTLHVSSGLRTLPQQYLLKQWDLVDACGTLPAAAPGRSRHESGLAIDVPDRGTWQAALEAEGFVWFGSRDRVHFTYSGGSDLAGQSVIAFQRLWNRNHPGDRIAEDGDFGPDTESRLRRSPAEGFPIGATCGAPVPTPTPRPDDAGTPSEPPPSEPPPSEPPPSEPPPAEPPPSICDSGSSCASCNSIAYECGWCASTGRCVPGGGAGPFDEACPTDWQWITPSSCPMPAEPEPEPTPEPPPPPPPAPMCLDVQTSCSATSECCSGLDCRSGVSFGVRCCARAATSCASGADCCGYMDCVSGQCSCRAAGRACLAGGDCCSGSCSAGTCS